MPRGGRQAWGQAIGRKLLLPRLNNEKGKKGKIKEEITELQRLIKNNLLIHFRNKPDRRNRYERDTGHSIFMYLI